NRDREIPRRDQRHHSERIAKRVLDSVLGLGGDHLTDLAHRLTGVVATDHHRTGDLAARLTDRLADLARDRLRDFLAARRDRLAPAMEVIGARRSGGAAPLCVCRSRSINRCGHLGSTADWSAIQDLSLIGGIAMFVTGLTAGAA